MKRVSLPPMPPDTDLQPDRLAPRIAIAGAGIGGLTAALALRQVGCIVDVYERAEALEAVGAGVQLSPNASIVLRRLGVLDALGSGASPSAEVLMRRGRDGAVLARIPLGSGAERRYGAPFVSALRADLQAALLRCASASPAIAIHLGRAIDGYQPQPAGVVLRFAGGATDTADALVAADGIHSAVRAQLAGSRTPRTARRWAYRGAVAAPQAEADALLPRSNLWLGRGAHLVHYPVGRDGRVNVVAVVDEGAEAVGASWSEPAERAMVDRRFAGWAAPARRLIASVPEWRRWPLFELSALPRWTDGRVTLLGDAAHPMLPFLAQGAAQAIEDAAALADAVAREVDLPRALKAYEARRRPRAGRVQARSRRQGVLYHLGPPASLVRDFALQRLGPERLVAKVDWLYDPPVEVRRFALG